MDEAIKSLVLAIKETLKDFTAGRLSVDECRRRYRRFSSDCDTLEAGRLHHTDLAASLCYLHSTENFSLFTGLYRIGIDAFTPLGTCGDDGFNLTLLNMTGIITSRLAGAVPISLPPGDGHELPHTIHACAIPGDSGIPLLFAAVSSSHFFSKNEFLGIAGLIGILRDAAEREMRPRYFSFFRERRATIDEFIKRKLSEGAAISAHYFLFNMVERIFNHMGLPEMLNISSYIKNTLLERFGAPDTPVFTLSMREYLILIPDASDASREKKKASFEYRGSSIPSQSLVSIIREEGNITGFWDEILDFERRIASGERIR
ncbi:MAG TPA: hypothetical protein PK875_06860 [Spirochaetota bacterium]|nr:MAG: hypothetical protein BWY96_00624 [Spirochaetes bacterium ADurb.BinA120]HPI13989.1 hypothetical protein [Spirochaetota bacterium]HPO45501.1 hypothetical protein [Spirochaetota bacterium]HPV96230.1 hypothetical protein [Spirochaetota bacterium]